MYTEAIKYFRLFVLIPKRKYIKNPIKLGKFVGDGLQFLRVTVMKSGEKTALLAIPISIRVVQWASYRPFT